MKHPSCPLADVQHVRAEKVDLGPAATESRAIFLPTRVEVGVLTYVSGE